MQSNFDRALSATLKHEGGWADHPKDPGGATMKGVTLATFRRLVKPSATKADLKAITADQLDVVYRKGFWSQIMADQLPAGIDVALFDYAVNSGPARAVKALQALVGAKVDGVVGPKTLAAVAETDVVDLIEKLCVYRLAFVKRLKTWPTFGKGWEKRIAAVRALALEMAADASAEPAEPIPDASAPEVPAQPSQPSGGFRPNWLKIAGWLAAAAIVGLTVLNLFT